MSTNAEFAADPFSATHDVEHTPGDFRMHAESTRPQEGFRGSFDTQSPFVSGVPPKPKKSNFVVRTWRVVSGFIVRIGKAVFSKAFWKDFILSIMRDALRDAIGGLGFSIGMRLIDRAAGTGDVMFQSKSGRVAPNSPPQGAQSAFSQSYQEKYGRTRAYGAADDIMASPIGNSRAFQQPSFTN